MKTLHLYLCRQVLGALVMTVIVFTFVLLLGNVLKEILNLLVNRQATFGLACHAILLLIPWVLAFSLPIGMLTATLLVFGRFSADQELTAARAGGISLVSLVAPVLVLSVVMSGICAWLNFQVSPSSRVAYNELLAGAGRTHPGNFLRSREYVSFGKYIVFAGYVHKDGTNLDDVLVTEYDKNNERVEWAAASNGNLRFDDAQRLITLRLKGMVSMKADKTNGWFPYAYGDTGLPPVPYPDAGAGSMPVSISDMTFRQLREQLKRTEQMTNSLPPPGASRDELEKARKELLSAASQTITPLWVYLNQQVAFSFACVAFTLTGIPLAIRGHRRETSIGVAAALVLVIVYYSFMVVGQAWQSHPERYPCLIIWLPNFIFEAVGVVLLWRINRQVG